MIKLKWEYGSKVYIKNTNYLLPVGSRVIVWQNDFDFVLVVKEVCLLIENEHSEDVILDCNVLEIG